MRHRFCVIILGHGRARRSRPPGYSFQANAMLLPCKGVALHFYPLPAYAHIPHAAIDMTIVVNLSLVEAKYW
jgi:hypothetical protein